jgi:hypothetical protein
MLGLLMEESNSKRVVWYEPVQAVHGGSSEDEYDWLRSRVSKFCSPRTSRVALESLICSFDQLADHLQQHPVERLIIACRNRWDYPGPEVRELAEHFPEVPMALAVGDWWMGWRRTGAGHLQSLPHLTLPWYRWWDGWVQWLNGSTSTQFGPFPSERLPFDLRLTTSVTSEAGWILWDDSQLATWFGFEASLEQAIQQLTEIQEQRPNATLWIAWTLPTWDLFTRLRQAGLRFELLGKPHLASLSSAALART